MFQASMVDPDFEMRQFFNQPSGAPGVIQMDVGGNGVLLNLHHSPLLSG
jgi:hypothetical protein